MKAETIVKKPTEEELKSWILLILRQAKFDKAYPGFTLYDYAIGWLESGVIPDPPQPKLSKTEQYVFSLLTKVNNSECPDFNSPEMAVQCTNEIRHLLKEEALEGL